MTEVASIPPSPSHSSTHGVALAAGVSNGDVVRSLVAEAVRDRHATLSALSSEERGMLYVGVLSKTNSFVAEKMNLHARGSSRLSNTRRGHNLSTLQAHIRILVRQEINGLLSQGSHVDSRGSPVDSRGLGENENENSAYENERLAAMERNEGVMRSLGLI